MGKKASPVRCPLSQTRRMSPNSNKDDVAWPEEKLFGQVLTGGFCLCSGDDIVVELHPGDFFPTLTPDSKNFDCWQMASQARSVDGLTKKHSAK